MSTIEGYTYPVTADQINRLLVGNLDEEDAANLLAAKYSGHKYFVFQLLDSGKPVFLFSSATTGELYKRRLMGRKEYIVREI